MGAARPTAEAAVTLATSARRNLMCRVVRIVFAPGLVVSAPVGDPGIDPAFADDDDGGGRLSMAHVAGTWNKVIP